MLSPWAASLPAIVLSIRDAGGGVAISGSAPHSGVARQRATE